MSQSVLTFLPALHGDAFIIHCYKGDNDGYIIVDGGPNINSRLNPFINEVEKISHIDLMIMTHQDDDHLVGIKKGLWVKMGVFQREKHPFVFL